MTRKYGNKLDKALHLRVDEETMTAIESFPETKGEFVRKAIRAYIRKRQEIEREKGRADESIQQ